MATATASRPASHATREDDRKATALDAAIQETGKRQSLVRNAATFLGVPIDKVCDLLRNVWKTSKDQPPLTDQEMFVGISLIARYELDPIAKEVYVTRGKGGVFAIVSVDGWIKILDRTDHYDGFTVELHESAPGVIDWVETTIYSKKRKYPTTYKAFALEYSRVSGMVAKSIPSHMLRIFSLRHAARLFTPIGGNVTTEEEFAAFAKEHAPTPVPTKLDDFTDKLSKPIEDLPDTSYEPPQAQNATVPIADESCWTEYVRELEQSKQIADTQQAYDRWFGPESTVEFTPEQHAEAVKLRDAKQADIRASRGSNSNKQRELV